MKKKNIKNLAIGVGLIGAMSVAGISAYFTATDTATNNFNVKKVDVDLTEPNYVDDQDITPNETIVKDPTVTNIGTTNQYVFLQVRVPYKNIITANLDGTRNAAKDTELFTWNSATAEGAINAAKGAGTGAVNSGWTLVKTEDVNTGTIYTYAYGSASEMTSLAPNAVTNALFNSVTMCNAVEGQGLEETEVDIDIQVLAIQDSDLKDSGNGTKVPSEVLAIYKNQQKTPGVH